MLQTLGFFVFQATSSWKLHGDKYGAKGVIIQGKACARKVPCTKMYAALEMDGARVEQLHFLGRFRFSIKLSILGKEQDDEYDAEGVILEPRLVPGRLL